MSVKNIVELSELENFDIITDMPTNKFFYGALVKTKGDEVRLQINKKYNPQKISTVIRSEKSFSFVFLYGTFLDLDPNYYSLFDVISNFYYLNFDKHTLDYYNKLLSVNDLSCQSNYSYFAKGLYPVDYTEIMKIVKDKNFDYNNFFQTPDDIPFYLSIASPHIFFLNGNNNNFIDFKNELLKKNKKFDTYDDIETQVKEFLAKK
jgi:hypothetical protein